MLMLGNLMKECGVVDRIQKTAGNELMNIITIFLALSVGCTTSANTFLNSRTLFIIVLGLIAFSFGTAAGVLCGKVMYALTGGQVNPLIGSAGVSAVPMAARVSQKVGQSENPQNFLLMHAMGPNVAGVIGSAVAAGILINMRLYSAASKRNSCPSLRCLSSKAHLQTGLFVPMHFVASGFKSAWRMKEFTDAVQIPFWKIAHEGESIDI